MTYQSFYVDLALRDDGRLVASWLDPNRRADQARTKEFISGQPLRLDDGRQWNLPGLEQLPHRFVWSPGNDPKRRSVDNQGEANATELIGLLLFEMVLPGSEAQRDWIGRFAAARAKAGVRLWLNLAPELETLPWELLRAGARWEHGLGERGFLALDERFSIVRSGRPVSEDDPALLGAGVTANGEQPLRLMIVDAGRSDLAFEGRFYEHLTTHDRTAVDRLDFTDPSLVAAKLDHAAVTATELARELRSGSGANAFHFTGHGDEASGMPPWLLLAAEKPFGQKQAVAAVRLSADELGENLRRANIEVAVLAACHAGTGAWWSGFGAALLAEGVPAIVSMQAMLENNAGDIFCSEVYRSLADGAELDAAVSTARRRVYEESSYKDWWLPLLHTRHEPLRFRATARRVAPTLRHRSQAAQPEIPVREEEWQLRPGTWEHPAALSPDGSVWALASDEGLRLRTVDGRLSLLLPVDGFAYPIAVSPIREGGVRVLTTSTRTVDWLVSVDRPRATEVSAVDLAARCAAWIGDRFVWSDTHGQAQNAGDLTVGGFTHISSAVGRDVTLTAWIEGESILAVHRATDAGTESISALRTSEEGAVSELVVAPTLATPERIWIREGLSWSGWSWEQLKEAVA